ncbi:SsrA-binding protein SmpB [Desulfonatronum lacustre]|uniref:SsrA-binding protein SmpB n=1 Tax=Desulfonatronum lacustre TaxID=66849 RepID=UPI00048FD349|nr:SsrA-binding protein SmpB [Desulfonatronum lacustre]SMP68858.1 SsrA-binding protein [Desulfonatronum zhilinae]
MKPKSDGTRLIAQNKKARHEYEILETLEAGLALMGSEVKSLRDGKVSFKDGYVRFTGGDPVLVGVHIAPYAHAVHTGHEPERPRKLLLHRHQIDAWSAKTAQKGLTVVPLKMYWKAGRAKVEIGLARGKKYHDQREDLKRRAMDRDLAREM